MDIKIVDDAGKEIIPEAPQEAGSPETLVITGHLLEQSVGQMFDLLPSEISRFSDKLGTLVDYAKSQTDNHTPEGIKWAIRALQGRVGTPPLGEKWLPYLSQYAWLKLDEIRLKKEVERYEHNDNR